jgi:hypothetical protein
MTNTDYNGEQTWHSREDMGFLQSAQLYSALVSTTLAFVLNTGRGWIRKVFLNILIPLSASE